MLISSCASQRRSQWSSVPELQRAPQSRCQYSRLEFERTTNDSGIRSDKPHEDRSAQPPGGVPSV